MPEKFIQRSSAAPTYIEDFTEEDFLLEEAPTYIEDFTEEDFLVEDIPAADEEVEILEDELTEDLEELTEDLNSSLPVALMTEAQVRSAATKVFKGAKVAFGYVNAIKLDAKYEQGKFVKKENKQYSVVKAIKVTEMRACTGIDYTHSGISKLIQNSPRYQDKLAARQAAGLGGFGTSVHDTQAGLENILVTTATGLKCVICYPLSTAKAHNTYYISVDGEDWRGTTKEEIAEYMTESAKEKFLHPIAYKAEYQAKLRNEAGQSVALDSDFTITDAVTGEKIKVLTSPLYITYLDSSVPYKGIFKFDKESAITVVPVAQAVQPEEDPLNQDFPDAEI